MEKRFSKLLILQCSFLFSGRLHAFYSAEGGKSRMNLKKLPKSVNWEWIYERVTDTLETEEM